MRKEDTKQENSKIRVRVVTRGVSKREGKRKESVMRPKERDI